MWYPIFLTNSIVATLWALHNRPRAFPGCSNSFYWTIYRAPILSSVNSVKVCSWHFRTFLFNIDEIQANLAMNREWSSKNLRSTGVLFKLMKCLRLWTMSIMSVETLTPQIERLVQVIWLSFLKSWNHSRSMRHLRRLVSSKLVKHGLYVSPAFESSFWSRLSIAVQTATRSFQKDGLQLLTPA